MASIEDGGASSAFAVREAAERACANGQVLACARHTWMAAAGPSLDVLLLADCLPLCEPPHVTTRAPEGCKMQSVYSNRTASRFPFATASWLRASP